MCCAGPGIRMDVEANLHGDCMWHMDDQTVVLGQVCAIVLNTCSPACSKISISVLVAEDDGTRKEFGPLLVAAGLLAAAAAAVFLVAESLARSGSKAPFGRRIDVLLLLLRKCFFGGLAPQPRNFAKQNGTGAGRRRRP